MNNSQIDKADYYLLPSGKYLEDFIAYMHFDFAWGSALKYRWRAGKKDGESREKDLAKMRHYCEFIARHEYRWAAYTAPAVAVEDEVDRFYEIAHKWRGSEEGVGE